MELENRVLRYFLAVVREGSITRAAACLHVTEPTISKQLHDMEKQLGKKLFSRSNYSMQLTDDGRRLYRYAERIIELNDSAVSALLSDDPALSGDVYIGSGESCHLDVLGRAIRKTQAASPEIRFHLISGDTQNLREHLESGLLDFAVLFDTPDTSRYHVLPCKERDVFGVVMRRNDPLAASSFVTLDDLKDSPVITARQALNFNLPAWFGEKKDSIHVAATVNLAYNGSVLAREGVGRLIVFDRLVDTGPESGLCFRPLKPELFCEINIVWKYHRTLSPAAAFFLDRLREELTQG